MLFDLDGTLIDSAPDLGAAADKMRTDRGLPSLPLERYRPMAGAGARGMLGVAFGIDARAPDFATLREEFFVNYEIAHDCANTHVFDGVAELLEALRARGLALGRGHQQVDALHRAADARDAAVRQRRARSSAATPRRTPSRTPSRCSRRRAGWASTPARCIYVGDDERDIVAGRAAGMRTVAATYGYLGEQADVGALGRRRRHRFAHGALEIAANRPKIRGLGLHWFRRGFGIAAGHVELNALVKQIQTN